VYDRIVVIAYKLSFNTTSEFLLQHNTRENLSQLLSGSYPTQNVFLAFLGFQGFQGFWRTRVYWLAITGPGQPHAELSCHRCASDFTTAFDI
jgi:hypothetical protein